VTCFADSVGFVLKMQAKWFSLPYEQHFLFFVEQESLWGYVPPQLLHFSSFPSCLWG